VRDVGGHGAGGARLHGGGVTRARHERKRDRGQQQGLPACRAPVETVSEIAAHGEEGGQHHEQAVTHEPHRAALRLEQHARHRPPLHRGRRPALEDGRLVGEHAEPRQDRRHHQRAARAAHTRLPAQRGGPVGGAGEKEHGAAADEENGAGEVNPAHEQTEKIDASQRHRMVHDRNRD
jgi:hypothetical protein